MQRSVRKNQRLQERLNAIQREMSRVESDIQLAAQVIENPDRPKSLRRLNQLSAEQDGSRQATVERLVPREDLFEKPAQGPGGLRQAALGEESDGFGAGTMIPKAPVDQRFVNYFVTGGLHSVRPLRQERRIQRNKAILMIIIAAVVVYGVISMLF